MTAQTETAPQQTGADAVKPPVLPSMAIVKQVISGDTVVVRGQPRGGPPPERMLSLAAINSGRVAKRETANAAETQDEPWAWEAREMLRERCIGKMVRFVVEYKVPNGREFVRLYVPRDAGEPVPEGASAYGANVAEELVAAGVVEVRNNDRGPSEYEQSLLAVQEQAKASKKGKWNPDTKDADHVRNIKWTHENPRALVDQYKQQPQKAIIEHVRDGSTVRALLLPNYDYVTVMMSGIRAPALNARGEDQGKPEPFAEEAKFFTESHLLNREIEIVLESVSNQNFLGTVKHPNGSIAALLLREGFAKCVDWSIGLTCDGVEKLRSAEKAAKDKKLRIWRSYEPSTAVPRDRKSFTATVTEIVMGDSMMVVRDGTDTPVKISLSSVRAPRMQDAAGDNKENQERPVGRDFRPLYDIPFMFEAREFLRKRLVGKKVQVTVDYVQPANVVGTQSFPERQCCTVVEGGVNVGEALVSKGLAVVIRYREGDENRSAHYDDLMAAQAKAEKDNLKLHALRNNPGEKKATQRVQDLQGDATKSKQFFPYLQRAGRCTAIVEFVSSGSRMRCYIPKETCLATILLAGISCPRGARPITDAKGTRMMPGEPYGEQAHAFTKSRTLQQEVEVEVESMDKAGNMIGWVFLNGSNLSELLVQEGFADVHFSAERSRYYSSLSNALEKAKQTKKNMWSNFVEEKNVEDDLASAMSASAVNGSAPARKVDYKRVVLTGADVTPENRLRIAVQFADDGKRLETLMRDIDEHLRNNPPLAGAHTPRRNEICLARFSVDNNWYRCKVESSVRQGRADVFFIDYGNREANIDVAKSTAALPDAFAKEAPGAREYLLALLTMPKDPEDVQNAINAMQNYCDGELSVNIEYKQGGVEHVTLVKNANKAGGSAAKDAVDDVGRWLIETGVALADTKRVKQRLPDLCAKFDTAMMTAKRNRENLWRYGDPTEDEA